MKIIKISGRLSGEERETTLRYDNIDKTWYLETTLLKHYNKCIKQGWTQTAEYQYEDGTVIGGWFVAPGRAVTLRNTAKKAKAVDIIEDLDDEDDE